MDVTTGAAPSMKYIVTPYRNLLGISICLLLFGLVMLTSASIAIAESQGKVPLYFLFRQCTYVGIAGLIAFVIVHIPMKVWGRLALLALLGSFILLALVLIPGIGHEVNGARRWVHISGVSLQVSEFVKILVILFMARYIERRMLFVQSSLIEFLIPIGILSFLVILLLLQPDFGAATVIMGTGLSLLFLTGAKWRHVLLIGAFVLCVMAVLIVTSPYRWERLTTFLNPWAYQFESGYQLTQALIAFGRGEWLGVGLGGSIQKLFYLPEAHTDFVFAVIAEELGMIGVGIVIIFYGLLFIKGLRIGQVAYNDGALFNAFVAYGVSIQIALTAVINMGVNIGLLPTKGLTLPLISYGGSSVMATIIGLAFIYRIGWENAHRSCDEKFPLGI